MNSDLSHWQDALEPQFMRRLTRPLRQAGVTNNQLANQILNRYDRFRNRLPLVTQQMQRWGQTATLQVEQVPIVYAKPISEDAAIAPATQKPVFSIESDTEQRTFAPETEFLPRRSRSTSPKLPIVAPSPVTSGFTSSENTLIQAKFETPQKPGSLMRSAMQQQAVVPGTGFLDQPPASQKPDSWSEFAVQQGTPETETGFLSSPPEPLPIVAATPIATSESSLINLNSAPEMVIQAKRERTQAASAPATPWVNAPITPAEVRSPIFSPNPPEAETSSTNPQAFSPTQSLPLVEAQLMPPTQPLTPLVFSTVGVGSDRTTTSQSRDPTSFLPPYSREEVSRLQESTISSLAVSASTHTSPVEVNQASQTAVSQPQPVDMETMVSQVERRLLRRLVIESERRGQQRWGLKS